MDFPLTDDYFTHAEASRNAFQSSAQLQYQDIRAVQESGIPFNLTCALTTLDVGYVFRGFTLGCQYYIFEVN